MNMTHLSRRHALGGLLTLSLAFLPGCGDDPEPEDPKLTGEWTGQVATPAGPASVTLGLSENDAGDVTGTMNWVFQGQPGSGPVTGTHNYPEVSLNLKIELFGMELTGKYEGRLTTEDRIEGTFATDDGSITGSVVLTRKAE